MDTEPEQPVDWSKLSPEEQAKSDRLKERDARKAKISFTLQELEHMWDALGTYKCTPYVMKILNEAMQKMKRAIDLLE